MITEIDQKSAKRNYLFDNFRAILIFLVVLGHMITDQLHNTIVIDTMYYFIFLFHMHAFIFISGYFSKNVMKSRDTAVQSFLVPYVILNTAFWLQDKITHADTAGPFRIFVTEWGLWFLLAMFVWKLFLKDLIRIRYILPISFIVGIMSGLSEEFTMKMSLARILSFLPFFLLGYFCNAAHINWLRKIPKRVTAFTLVVFIAISYLSVKYEIIKKEFLYMRKPFSTIDEEILNSILIRSFVYIAAIIITICFINLLSSRKSWLSIIGRNSITIYIIHLFLVPYLRKLSWPWDETIYYSIYAIVIALSITYLFSRPIVLKIYNKIMNKITYLIMKPIPKV